MAKLLVVVHQATSNPWAVGQILTARGHELDIRRPSGGDALPEIMDAHDGAIIFGGPMSANDDLEMPFMRDEMNFIPRVLRADKPFLGICLGAQMLARVLGGSVWPHPRGLVEVGFSWVEPTEEGRHFLPEPMTMYQWHREGLTLPHTAKLLATGSRFKNQLFSYNDTAVGVQFHAEVTREMMERWSHIERGGKRLTMPGAQSRETQLQIFDRVYPKIQAWQEDFLGKWCALCQTEDAPTENPMPLSAAGD